MPKILVVGSISIDNVVYTKVLPQPGMTVIGEAFLSNVGGKGANQACAATFLGADVSFYGAVGMDKNGEYVREFLSNQGLDFILKDSKCPTGIASITIDMETSENRICIVPGANMDISTSDIDKIEPLFKESSILLIQLENPVDTVCYALKKAKQYGLTTILNPAPVHEIPKEIYQYIDFFVPNEHEVDAFVSNSNLTFEEKAKELVNNGIKNVIITLGEKGSLLATNEGVYKVDPNIVDAVDTTAAGDSFLGALVTALSEGKDTLSAMKFASKCSSITVTRKGAISSLPHREEIKLN